MRRYRRFFVMFELEDKNFGIFASEESRGYAKFEIKNNQGLLSIYCQSLKSSNGNRYQWYLIDTKTDGAPTIVEIGSMKVDERGKGEITCEFNAENVKGSMVQIDDFNILALIVQNKHEEDKLYAPLVGYIDKKRPDVSYWRYALGKYLHIPIDEGTAREKTAQFYQPVKKVEEKPVKEATKEIEIIEGAVKEKAAEETAEQSAEGTTGETAREAVERAKEIEEKVAERVIEETVEEPVREPVEEIEVIEGAVKEKVAEGTTEQIAEKTIEEPVGEIAEEVVEEPVGVGAKEPVEESVKETVGEVEIIEGAVEDKAAEEAIEQIIEETIEETVGEAAGEVAEGPVEEAKETKEEVAGETTKETMEDDYEIQMQAYIENSLKGFLDVEPFIDKIGNYVWWQIPYDVQTMYRAYMPFISYLDSLREPTDQADYYVSRMAQIVYIHQHHIFGICYDENNRARYYAYGILGRNLSMEQPFELDENFVYWHPCDNVPSNIESYGYWILTIDPKTGDAVKCK